MSYQSQVLALSPSVFLPLNDASTNAFDLVTSTNVGTIISGLTQNQASFMAGDTSGCLSYPGSGSGRVTLPASEYNFTGTAPYTLMAWVEPTFLDNTDRRIFSKELTGGNDGYYLSMRSSAVYIVRRVAGTYYSESATVSTTLNLPHMIVWCFDGVNSQVYLDGATIYADPHGGSLADLSSVSLTLGQVTQIGQQFYGLYKDFAAWDGTALTLAQVQALYQAGMAGRSPLAVMRGNVRRPALPVGSYNVNNSVFRSPNAMLANVKVFEQAMTLKRILIPVNCENTNFQPPLAPDRVDYGRGTGGTWKVQFCTVNSDGTPNLSNVLANESFAVADRYAATQTLLDVFVDIQVLYVEMGGVSVAADTPYAIVVQSTEPAPTVNWISANNGTTTQAIAMASPHNFPTMSKYLAGAINGLDPRERLMWSHDSGTTWRYGPAIGGGALTSFTDFLQYEYTGYDLDNHSPNVSFFRLPFMCWQTTADYAANPMRYHADSPYCGFGSGGPYSMLCMGTPRSCVITHAGGLSNSQLGVVTVTNIATGASAVTPSLGGGLQIGALNVPITLTADAKFGDNFQISASGSVNKQLWDAHLVNALGLGATLEWPFITSTVVAGDRSTDTANLFVLDSNGDWPFYASRQAPRLTAKP